MEQNLKSKIPLLILFSSSLFSMDNLDINLNLTYSPIVLDGHQKFGISTTKVSFDDLGINSSNNILIPSMSVLYDKKHKFLFSIMSYEYGGSKVLNKDITKDDYTYISGTNIKSSTDTTFISTGYRNVIGDVSYGLDINSYKYNVSVSDSLNSTSIENSFLFPTLNIDMRTDIRKYNFDFGASVGDGSDISYINLYFSGGFDLEYIKNSNISLGYKLTEFYINDGIYESFHRYKGPFINLNVKF